jgi:hypothetical protein
MRTKGVRRVDQDQARKIIGTWGSGGMIHRKEKREREGRNRREKDREDRRGEPRKRGMGAERGEAEKSATGEREKATNIQLDIGGIFSPLDLLHGCFVYYYEARPDENLVQPNSPHLQVVNYNGWEWIYTSEGPRVCRPEHLFFAFLNTLFPVLWLVVCGLWFTGCVFCVLFSLLCYLI